MYQALLHCLWFHGGKGGKVQTKKDSLPDVFQKPNPLGEFTRLEEKVMGTQVLREETDLPGQASRRMGLGEKVRKPYSS